ncbi:hypothetical protein ACFW3N_14910 [Streptomyces sp. NPDC058834]|uniref:hypothetical protein n=1 Tax=Streptomyces sp. NPDC058834 TaxID=3346647 RepID=UPI0036D0E407
MTDTGKMPRPSGALAAVGAGLVMVAPTSDAISRTTPTSAASFGSEPTSPPPAPPADAPPPHGC